MKYSILLLILSFSILTVLANGGIQEINAILGDKSFKSAFGRSPNKGTGEILRIQTHLSYVERTLESKNLSALDTRQLLNREKVMSLLHEYWTAGLFPSNHDFQNERRPCFIDRDGNICAVGYLIEKTVGRSVAEQVNARHQYAFILDMNEPILNAWASEYGLTLEECAMIQPAYGPPPAPIYESADIKTNYGITSGIAVGINMAVTIANFSHPSSVSNTVAYVGLATGAAQIVMGAVNIKQTERNYLYLFNGGEIITSYKAQNNLSYVNIALGTTTVISSALRLWMNSKNREARNAYNIYSYPNYKNSLTLGISLKRSI